MHTGYLVFAASNGNTHAAVVPLSCSGGLSLAWLPGQARLVTNLEHLNVDVDGESTGGGGVPMPELQHNLRLLVDLAEADIARTDGKLRQEKVRPPRGAARHAHHRARPTLWTATGSFLVASGLVDHAFCCTVGCPSAALPTCLVCVGREAGAGRSCTHGKAERQGRVRCGCPGKACSADAGVAQDTAVILGREQARLREEVDTARRRVERASHVLQARAPHVHGMPACRCCGAASLNYGKSGLWAWHAMCAWRMTAHLLGAC